MSSKVGKEIQEKRRNDMFVLFSHWIKIYGLKRVEYNILELIYQHVKVMEFSADILKVTLFRYYLIDVPT